MNIAKIQSDVIAALVRGNKKNYTYGIGSHNGVGFVGVCSGPCLYLVRSKDFLIDLDKWGTPSFSPNNLMSIEPNTKPAEKTLDMQYNPIIKSIIVKIANESSHAWVDEKKLKMFSKDCTFRIYNRKSPVFVYEDNELVGLVLPVNVKGETD